MRLTLARGPRSGIPRPSCPGQGPARRLRVAEDRMPRTGSANRDICSPADDVSLGFRERRVETRG